MKKCTYNGLQCCSSITINLFESGIDLAINDYAPILVDGFATVQDALEELRNTTKGMYIRMIVFDLKHAEINHLLIYYVALHN